MGEYAVLNILTRRDTFNTFFEDRNQFKASVTFVSQHISVSNKNTAKVLIVGGSRTLANEKEGRGRRQE